MFNEATVIGSVVTGLLEEFSHVVCVDDGSSDGSAAIARSAGAVVVQHPVNLGQGAALQTGFEYALQDPELEAVITFDADGQHRVADAAVMLARVRAGEADVVLGSRFLEGSADVSRLKRLVLRTAALQSRMSTGLQLTDAHNGLRVFNRTVAEGMNITLNGMGHASQIVEMIAHEEWRVAEEPVTILYTEYSMAKGQSLINGVNILFDALLRTNARR